MRQARRVLMALASLAAVGCVLLLPNAVDQTINGLVVALLLAIGVVLFLLLWEVRSALLADAPPRKGGDPFWQMLDSLDEAERMSQTTRARARRVLDDDRDEVARRGKWRWN